jgi:hypothetical protein
MTDKQNNKLSEVPESTQYDNHIGKKSNNYVGVLPVEDIIQNNSVENNEKENHWVGMPEFEQEENAAFKTLFLHFRTEEDYNEFCKKYTKEVDNEQFFSKKTKSIWYPHLDKDANTLKRWMEQGND